MAESIEGEGSSYFTLPINKPVDKMDSLNKLDLIENFFMTFFKGLNFELTNR
jgi:hypothetical protein